MPFIGKVMRLLLPMALSMLSATAAGQQAPKASPPAAPVAEATTRTPPRPEVDPAAQPPAGAAPTMTGATFRVRLRDLEQRVDELKEQIRRSHARLALLSDTILSGGQSGGRVDIRFENGLSAAWHIIEIIVIFDGAVQYKKADESGLISAQKAVPIFSGAVTAGDHTIQVMVKLKGHGFGLFAYSRGIEASVRQDYAFSLTAGQDVVLSATAWEKGGPTLPAEKRPDVRFQKVVSTANQRPVSPAARPAAPRPAAPRPAGGS